jgi:hypothetical protein
MNSNIDLNWLFPKVSDFAFPPSTPEQLSAFFIGLLLFITTFFLLKSFWSSFKARRRVAWLSKLLSGLESESAAIKRNDLLDSAGKQKDSIGHLWQEFDETLIEIKRNEIIHLYNTLDAAYFFNPSTLAKGITENRLIAAVPGFLTAIGVVGTFVGLQLGLSELNISSEVSVDEMKSGVSSVIGGAKVAFLTSVWGVSLSVLFNFIEKFLEQGVRKKISALQDQIDDIFPRLSAEAQLQDISDNSYQSRESLQGLAEKIGEKMQESLVEATHGIQQGLEASLEKIMAPAINKLVDETSEGNQKALEDLLEKFMDGFGQQGEQQRQSMDSASDKVNGAVEGMSTSLEAFINRLEANQSESIEREKELASTVSERVSYLIEQSNKQGQLLREFTEQQTDRMENHAQERDRTASEREQELFNALKGQVADISEKVSLQSNEMSQFVEKQMEGLVDSFNARDKKVSEIEQARNETLEKQIESLDRSATELLTNVENTIKKQQAASLEVLKQGRSLQQSVDSSVHASVEATQSMKATAAELRAASDNMNVFSSHIKDAGNKMSGAITEAVESTKDLASQNQISVRQVEALREELINDLQKFNNLADKITEMLNTAGRTFNDLKTTQSDFLGELKGNVRELSEQMSKLLSDYAQQANSQTTTHLKVWSDSTTQYAEQMNRAVSALSNVVDEIEEKVV